MSVSATTTSVSYTGDGSVTSFAVTFAFQGTGSASELTVVERTIATGVEVTKSYTSHYTVTGGSGSTGTVIAASAPASTVQWHIRRNTTTTQTTDYVTNDPFAANTIETDFDRLTMAGQERDGDIAQSFKFPDTYTGGASTTFPEPVADAYVLFNSAGDALTTSTTSAGQHLGSNGTVSLPYYSFTSDPNTGMYRVGADQLGWAVNGVKGLDLSTTGLTVTGELDAATLDISGNADIDGTTNLDAVDIDGNVQLDGTLSIGVDDTGFDVKFFGATSGRYMLWDESADNLLLSDSAKLILGQPGNDLQIYHDGSNSYIRDAGDGALYIDGSANVNIRMGGDGGETAIQCIDDGAVSLYYNNAVKIATASTGVTITGEATATGFTGTLDGILGSGTPAAATVTTIDASGVATATTFEPDGDTSAADNAAIGYTSAEGLILTGQGSTNDITVKNDADVEVIGIPTGTTDVQISTTTAGTGVTSKNKLTLQGITGNANPNGLIQFVTVDNGESGKRWGMYTNAVSTADFILGYAASGTFASVFEAQTDLSVDFKGAVNIAGAAGLASLTLTTDLSVANGGTGASTFAADGVLYGAGTGAVAATAVGTDGHVLTSNGSGSAPAFAAVVGGIVSTQVFTSSGTWTRPSGIRTVLVKVVGGGGGGGGVSDTSGVFASGGGGSGGYAYELIDVSSTSSATVTIGAGGAGGAAGNNAGATGATSSFAALVTATGGVGGGTGGTTAGVPGLGGAGGTGAGGDYNGTGFPGHTAEISASHPRGGTGGGEGGGVAANSYTSAGVAAVANTGGGGSGGQDQGTTERAGGAGGSGHLIVWEYS